MPDRPRRAHQPQRPQPSHLIRLCGLACMRGRAAALILGVMFCTALLPLGGCGMSVKPSGQVATEISVGR
ncbi:hypothetical protein [Desulfovibrio sp.]|uniref:hypothetical protein n=1 Tax=Desulfovibrio sp. TaxID=885 RepID=UPI0035B23FEF